MRLDFLDVFQEISRREQIERPGRELAEFYKQNGVDPQIAQRYTCLTNFKLEDVREGFLRLVSEGYNPNAVAILLTDESFRREQTSQSTPRMQYSFQLGRYVLPGATDRRYKERLEQGETPVDAAKFTAREMNPWDPTHCMCNNLGRPKGIEPLYGGLERSLSVQMSR